MSGIQGLPARASWMAVRTVGAVLGGGGDADADGVPVAGGLLGAEPTGDLLLGLGGPMEVGSDETRRGCG
jgi:hypothetical protein